MQMRVTGSTMAAFSKSRLASISILLIDPDKELSLLIRKVLKALGFSTVHVARDGSSALQLMKKEEIDIVITDWDMTPMSGIEFLSHVRNHDESPNPFVPIIMLTGHAKRKHVEIARDKGITEFMVKPFTTKALCDRIILVIDHPRNFIMSPGYRGPDRRRRTVDTGETVDRRQTDDAAGDNLYMLDVDYTLKDKLGANTSARELFSEASVKEAQRVISNSRGKFLEWVVGDLSELEEAYRALEASPEEHNVLAMANAAMRVKGRAGTFGYDLASQVAESLNDITRGSSYADPKRLIAVRKHIDVLYVIFQRNILGGGGAVGKDLMDSLEILSKKYRQE
jgi:CheY-like chemotaxis protein